MMIMNNDGSVVSMQPSNAVSVSPSDTEFLEFGCTLYIGTGGDVKVTTFRNDDVLFSNLQGGTTLPVIVKKVWTTGTTADNIVALW